MTYEFARYVSGKEMAEGVTVRDAPDLNAAIQAATMLCPRDAGPSVLVLCSDGIAAVERDNLREGIRATIDRFPKHSGEWVALATLLAGSGNSL